MKRRRTSGRRAPFSAPAISGSKAVGKRELIRVRKIALALPEVNERMSHGALCFFIRNKLPLCYFHDNHRGDGRISLWCPTAPDLQDAMMRVDPERFLCPSTSSAGHFRDWLGVFLGVDDEVDWDEIAFIRPGLSNDCAQSAHRQTRWPMIGGQSARHRALA